MNRKQFRKIYIEITNCCNLHCRFCSIGTRQSEMMPVEMFRNIAQQAKEHTSHVYLHVKGEPLLHPQLREILDICEQNNLKVVIVTNGTLLHEQGAMLLTKKAIRQINISLHCVSELQQLKKEEYLDEVIRFTQQATEKTALIVSLRFWNIDRVKRSQEDENRAVFEIIEQALAPNIRLLETLKPAEGLKINNQLYINSDYEFEWPSLSCPQINKKGSCHGLRDQIAILADGTIVPCCLDSDGIINLGNIKEITLQEAFESPRAQRIHSGFLQEMRVEPLCQRCSFNKRTLQNPNTTKK